MIGVSRLFGNFAAVVDLVYPPRCPCCGIAIANQAGLCSDCWTTLEVPPQALQPGSAVAIYAATYYGETSRHLVLAYKHGGKIALARLLSRLMAARLPESAVGAAPPVLIPVPLHRWRLWRRGFNQAALLTQELERLGKGEAHVAALIRHRRTPPLSGLGREARDRALRDAVRLNPRHTTRLAGRHVILVDDVLTSGATTRACIAALAHARPASVTIACFARVDYGRHLHNPET